ncbi:P-loop containing nucleoside triphosphate hydrolase protein [Gaertneriomyces semiglobifer]|nr:P-loop containing nucleoside triphosphate hydrolase protein [Gaertneriomyces semiglobifer]
MDAFCGDSAGFGPWLDDDWSFTPCFEQLVLAQIPYLFLLSFGVARLFQLFRGPGVVVNKDALYWAKMISAAIVLTSQLVGILHAYLSGATVFVYNRIAYAMGTAAFSVALILQHHEQLRSRSSSIVLSLFWFGTAVVAGVHLRTTWESERGFNVGIWSGLIGLIAAAVACVLELLSKDGIYYSSLDEDVHTTPEDGANILSRLTFHWMNPLMKLGYRKNLEMDDLWNLKKVDTARHCGSTFQANWNQEALSRSPSLLKACIRTWGATFGSAAFFKLGQDILSFVQPILLKRIIEFANSWNTLDSDRSQPQPLSRGFTLACLMLITALTQTALLHQYFQICVMTGMRVRSAVVTTIYRKSLVLSNASRQSSTVGEIVNLQSVDAGRISELCSYFHIVWSGPFQIVLAIYFLHQTLGPSIYAGIAMMILMVPINAVIATKSRTLSKAQMAIKDTRVRLMDELLNGIKVIKLYAWEKPFLEKIFNARDAELNALKRLGLLSAVQSFTWSCTPLLVSFMSFAVYTLVSDQPLTSSKVFVSISLFNLLQFPLAMFPMVITHIIEASVSFTRLRTFLLNEELDITAVKHQSPVLHTNEGHNMPVQRLAIKDASFRWTKNGDNSLHNISLAVQDGMLLAIVGSVGSGKSSLISAFLGEMYKVSGEVIVSGSLSYVPQNAWIMNATLKENVVFGKPFDQKFYDEVISACGLKSDLEVLPGGDSVEIGERGINLSGGQKQRVSLARAVYSRSDIYLFDDALSAVDAHVGRHIFDNVLGPKGILRDKARLLVTHGIHFLPDVDEVVVMKDGSVVEEGPYVDLMTRQGQLYTLMKEFGKRAEGDAAEDVDGELEDGKAESGEPSPLSQRRLSRRASTHNKLAATESDATTRNKIPEPSSNLMTKEEKASGSVEWSVYKDYAKACSTSWVAAFLGMMVFMQLLSVAQNLYLADWAAENDRVEAVGITDDRSSRTVKRLAVYGGLGFLFSLAVVAQAILVYVFIAIRSARSLHSQMLENVVRSPMSFFDTTPLGRVMNRFSKDQYTIDEILPRVFQSFFRTLFTVVAVIAVNILGSPIFFLFVLPLGVLYLYFQRYYLATSRELKRLDSTSRSPIYAHFSETLGGVSSIRAYKQESRFITANEQKVDSNMKAYYPSVSSNRWLAVRLEFIGSLIVFGSALFSVITIYVTGHVSASIVGLMLTYSLNVTQSLNWMVRQCCEIETNIVAMERVKEYIELPQEAAYELPSETPPPTWPSEGRVTFDHYSSRYRSGLELVLKDISFAVNRQEKIGIVGRTGAGKSSTTLALFRLIEAATGRITIDDIDISRLGLFDLRSRLTIIPQDAVLFSGTIRDNLDPFGVHDDVALWEALENASLKRHVETLNLKLSAEVLQGGENFSVGQRQLICLARALLRKTHILVLDEATAAIDVETDTIIQKTIRKEFKDCTIFTIAHRINTVMDSDRILVLDRGQIAEFDTPANLLRNKKSIFYGLAKEAGQAA